MLVDRGEATSCCVYRSTHPRNYLPHVIGYKQVACGTDATAAVTLDGKIVSWGRGARLGHGDEARGVVRGPTIVQALVGVVVRQVSLGDSHAACIVAGGAVLTWGSTKSGCLGRQDIQSKTGRSQAVAHPAPSQPVLIPRHHRSTEKKPPTTTAIEAAATPAGGGREELLLAVQIECGHFTTAAIAVEDGSLWTWGSNAHHVLGLGDDYSRATPQWRPVRNPIFCGDAAAGGDLGRDEAEEQEVEVAAPAARRRARTRSRGERRRCVDVALGSVYAAAIDASAQLWTWGYGGHGNLGRRV